MKINSLRDGKMKTRWIKIGSIIVFATILVVAVIYLLGLNSSVKDLSIIYPYDKTIFPPDIASPTFRWDDKTSAARWTVFIEFQDSENPLAFQIDAKEWTPQREEWESIKKRSVMPIGWKIDF